MPMHLSVQARPSVWSLAGAFIVKAKLFLLYHKILHLPTRKENYGIWIFHQFIDFEENTKDF